MKKSILPLGILLVFISSTPFVSAHMHTTTMSATNTIATNKNVVENAIASADHSTLVAAVSAAGLVDALQASGPFTVFAPVNSAFEKLPAGTVENLLLPENKDMLTSILTYHVVAGNYLAKDLVDGLMLPTLQGDMITFSYKNGMWYIDNTLIQTTDILSSNGVIHTIDSVIMPKE